jgi:hypothetical protein
MNALIHTPLLRSRSLRTDFDNKILVIFLGIILILIILGLLFVDLMGSYTPPLPVENEEDSDFTQVSIYT